MTHREPRHLEEWATLLGDDLSDELVDRDDADRWLAEDTEQLFTDDDPA